MCLRLPNFRSFVRSFVRSGGGKRRPRSSGRTSYPSTLGSWQSSPPPSSSAVLRPSALRSPSVLRLTMATNAEDSRGAHTVAPSSLRLRFAEARRASNSQGGGDFETNTSSFSEIIDRRRRPNKLETRAVPVPLKKRYMGETVPRPCPCLLQTGLHMRDARHHVLRMHCACTAHTTRTLRALCVSSVPAPRMHHLPTRRRASGLKRGGMQLASAPSMAPSGPCARRSRAPATSGGRGIGYARQAH